MVVGWGLVWRFANQRPQPVEPVARAEPKPEPWLPTAGRVRDSHRSHVDVVPRDNAAYSYFSKSSHKLTPVELAAQSRRDILFTHLWERPELYRGVPIHLLGTARGACSASSPSSARRAGPVRGLDRFSGRHQVSVQLRLRGSSRGLSPGSRRIRAPLSSTVTSSRS